MKDVFEACLSEVVLRCLLLRSYSSGPVIWMLNF